MFVESELSHTRVGYYGISATSAKVPCPCSSVTLIGKTEFYFMQGLTRTKLWQHSKSECDAYH
jgi:hypothetical protein